MIENYLFTSESVSEGHPDKVCDRISDAILDAFKKKEPNSRTAIETLVTNDTVIIAGEIYPLHLLSSAEIDAIVRSVIKDIGYTEEGFDYRTVKIVNYLQAQSVDISLGVDKDGAGDQGIMFGYAVDEGVADNEYMPSSIYYSHKILRLISEARRAGELPQLLPDAKAQVTLSYEGDKPVFAHTIVLSTQHKADVGIEEIKALVCPYIRQALPEGFIREETQFYINPTGRFVIGGPVGDTGLTGRKIIVDTYGGYAPHGGGAFSGKDATKVDRSASYVARYLAKNIVASGVAKKCLIQLSYAIGIAKPLSIFLNTFGTSEVSEQSLINKIETTVDLTPKGIITHLELQKPIYEATANYGHFGRTPSTLGHFSWEKRDLINDFRQL